MTEIEAKEWLECIVYEQAPKTQKAMLLGIKALEEVQQLRKDMWKLNQICRDYTSLGTVEELKEAKEKQIAKKPIWKTGDFINRHHCPCCNEIVWIEHPYCECGQKLDWGNEDDKD